MSFILKIIENDYNSEDTKAFIFQFVKWSPGYALILLVIGSTTYFSKYKIFTKLGTLKVGYMVVFVIRFGCNFPIDDEESGKLIRSKRMTCISNRRNQFETSNSENITEDVV